MYFEQQNQQSNVQSQLKFKKRPILTWDWYRIINQIMMQNKFRMGIPKIPQRKSKATILMAPTILQLINSKKQ